MMKKLYSFILTSLLMLVTSFTANAIDIILNLDNPDNVVVKVNYGAPLENLVKGDNPISAGEYQQVEVTAKDGFLITSAVKSLGGADSEIYVNSMTSFSAYITSGDQGAKFIVMTASADDARDGSCTIIVDDPANVSVQRSGTNTYVNLNAGENIVKYMTDKELPLTIGSKDYNKSLYQVKVNDEVVNPQGSAWRISPKNGDKIEIFANFPDVDVPIKFVYANDEAKGFITEVTIDNVPVDNYNDDNFTVKAGKQIAIAGNTSGYKLNSFKVNGIDTYFYSSYSMIVTAETTFEIDAHKYGTVKATLDIDNPANVMVYRGYSYNNDMVMGLRSGENPIELSETNTMITVKPASGCFITSLTANGAVISADYNGDYNITVTEGMKIVVISGAIERDSKAMIYIDDRSAATQYFNFERTDRTSMDIATGYNEIAFYEGDNPFGLSWYGASFANVYINNTAVAPLYENSTTYQFSLNDGDVVKIYLASDPATSEAQLIAAESLETGKVAVTFDRITEVADWAKTHTVLPGTEISIKPADKYEITVSADGKAISPDSDGAYIATVSKDTAINIKPVNTGVDDVTADSDAVYDVYNLQGIRVADSSDMDRLPAGIYVVNGKKMLKR